MTHAEGSKWKETTSRSSSFSDCTMPIICHGATRGEFMPGTGGAADRGSVFGEQIDCLLVGWEAARLVVVV